MYMHALMHAYIMYICTSTYTHKYMHVHICLYIQIHTCIAYVHTYLCLLFCAFTSCIGTSMHCTSLVSVKYLHRAVIKLQKCVSLQLFAERSKYIRRIPKTSW